MAETSTIEPEANGIQQHQTQGNGEITHYSELIAATKDGLTEQFCQRYQISKSGFYARRKALGLDPVELPNEEGWMLTPEQMQLFDLLHDWINAGKPMKTFRPPSELMAIAIEDGELLEQEQSRLRRAQELRAASLIATYREAAKLGIDDLPCDLRERVQEERGKFLSGQSEESDLETMVNDLISGRL